MGSSPIVRPLVWNNSSLTGLARAMGVVKPHLIAETFLGLFDRVEQLEKRLPWTVGIGAILND
ncbi:MAG: hypothetical protein ACM37W_17020 [Actinomycetota bacterium]